MHVLLTGATGFIGSAVCRQLASAGVDVVAASRHGAQIRPIDRRVRGVNLDITDKSSLDTLDMPLDVIVHCASYVGTDPDSAERVNVDGTAHLLQFAAARGVQQFVLSSTTAVYGTGPHRGPSVGQLVHSPESTASRTRAWAEQLVFGANGTVVRPHLVVGAGDRWVAPAVAAVTAAIGGLVDGGRAEHSVITVERLAALIAGMAVAAEGNSRAVHASHPARVSTATLVAAISSSTGSELPREPITLSQAYSRAEAAGIRRRLVDMLAFDHWYDTSATWIDGEVNPGPSFSSVSLRSS